MTSNYDSVIPEAQLSELSLLVTSEGFTLEAASKELCDDVLNALVGDSYEEEDVKGTAAYYAKGWAEGVNDDGFEEQIRCLYDCYDFDFVKTSVLDAIAALKSAPVKS
jgi:hypothetical protein